MSDQRYLALLKGASEYFLSAEASSDEVRLAAIAEINDLMAQHKLTVADLI